MLEHEIQDEIPPTTEYPVTLTFVTVQLEVGKLQVPPVIPPTKLF
jgi:hypothetical protein